ncbi:NUDIX hydrolase [Vibrio sp. HB161653]|nr:NUDIX domain-containing protein [Vibrio sp. HB161653]MDP5253270.1 NUDIX domain-containing protein [Vibrio sp. HB161653]
MRHLKTHYHPETPADHGRSQFSRYSTRAIALQGSDILVMYTQRYQDYSLPGGGMDEGESRQRALLRELSEETGARLTGSIYEYGQYEEYRPWHRDDYDVMHQVSFCYLCEVDKVLGDNQLEAHEIKNGMTPMWLDIHTAIAHNEQVIANSSKKGLSIERETFLLKHIANHCLEADYCLE